VRVLIIADVHGNLAALEAVLADPHDVLICLGDMVGYGPEPRACVHRVLPRASLVVRGNHDHALATGVAARCDPSLEWLAEATAPLGAAQLSGPDRDALARLPLRLSRTIDGIRYDLVHAAPSDPLYRRLEPGAEAWVDEAEAGDADVLLVGHTHAQFRCRVGGRTIVSPGSVGQPRDGDSRAAYAIMEDGNLSFCRVAYPLERTVAGLERSPADPGAVAVLTQVLRTGRAPTGHRLVPTHMRPPRAASLPV
jgi:putative phosphoesterase